ncbi:Synerg-CTERM sorting domain-containing protein [uncultured Fretibacterium sp.]|uniref:Synerg-CTERM sorting domain-containing protein n=1 Tax=uncultured Fretibacterium sp. TaxID=1678694 RepID=UPI0026038E76|nr:Synerg-CTERM sorting domain-containing protein [uncultured Fretibacterium sp.]
MSKKLKLFGLLALTLALGAGAAWAFGLKTIVATDTNDYATTTVATSVMVGTGTKGVAAGQLDFGAPNHVVQLKAATKDDILTIAPTTNKEIKEGTATPNTGGQLIVNYDPDLTSELGTVVLKSGNKDNPDATHENVFGGGTVLLGGKLGLTRGNSIGQGWVGIMGRAKDKAPVLMGYGVDSLILGHTDPGALIVAGRQPLYLLAGDESDAGPALDALRYAVVDSTPNSSSGALQGLEFRDGLAQLDVANIPDAGLAAAINPTGDTAGRFVRLVKTGNGMMRIYGSAQAATLAASATHASNISVASTHFALDGAFHRGGTTVVDGTLQMIAGVGTVPGDHFRGSLGKTWAEYQGSKCAYAPADGNANFVKVTNHVDIYNPLRVEEKGKVILDRSQFFDDFNIVKGGVFQAEDYLVNSKNFYPQIAVVLHQKNSVVDGLLKGNFDLILDAKDAVALRPKDDPKDDGIAEPQQAVLYINGENEIGGNGAGAKGDTLVSTGVLQIAKAKSIGAGEVTIGAEGAEAWDRGYTTQEVGVFAAAASFDLPNVTRGQKLGAAGAVNGATLTFQEISLMNRGIAKTANFRINPRAVKLGYGYHESDKGGEQFKTDATPTGNAFHDSWTGTVAFGGSGSWDVAGTMSNPTRVDIERGALRLDSYPMSTSLIPANAEPFMHVFVWPEAVLSLADGVRDFNLDKAHRMNLWVTDDSRINLVLNDSDIASSRADAMGKAPVFQAHEIDYTGLGAGQKDRDRRLVIQLDTSKLSNPKSIPAGWVKAVFSTNAPQWNRLHFLRENSNVNYEDYAKVRIVWSNTSDLPENTKAVAHLDENSNTILIEFGANVTDPVNPGKPTPETPSLTTTLTPSATSVAPGAEVTVTLGEWTYKGASADVVSEDVTVTGGTIKTPLAGKKVVLTAGAEGTMTVTATSVLKSDPKVTGKGTTSITVTKGGGSGKKSSSGGGCDAGFGGLALALAAAFLLKRKA